MSALPVVSNGTLIAAGQALKIRVRAPGLQLGTAAGAGLSVDGVAVAGKALSFRVLVR